MNPFGLTGKDRIEKDNRKQFLAIENGFKFFKVYSNDPKEIIEQTKQLILKAIYEEDNS